MSGAYTARAGAPTGTALAATLALLPAVLPLAGCGQTGPLYLPERPPAAEAVGTESGSAPADGSARPGVGADTAGGPQREAGEEGSGDGGDPAAGGVDDDERRKSSGSSGRGGNDGRTAGRFDQQGERSSRWRW